MNSKKAKRIRQLVIHLQEKGAVGEGDWAVYGVQKNAVTANGPTKMLDPACGKAIYKQMKKRVVHSGKAHD